MDNSRSVYGRSGSRSYDECPVPVSPETLANTLAELSDARGLDVVSQALRTRGVGITLEGYDNWDGGIWTWLITVSLPPRDWAAFNGIEERNTVERELAELANAIVVSDAHDFTVRLSAIAVSASKGVTKSTYPGSKDKFVSITPEELRQILVRPEGLKLDFKREYKLNSQPPAGVDKKKWKIFVDGQWDELIKDVIALTNGNSGTVGQDALLVVGVDDKPDGTGIRPLYDTSHLQITSQQIMAKVNAACDPPIPDILCERVELSGKTILVIKIPFSPHLHETKRQLNVSKGIFNGAGELIDLRPDKTYTAHTAFIRRGEDISPATSAERLVLQREKSSIQETVTTIDEDPEIPEDEPPPISPNGMEDHASDVIRMCEEAYSDEPIRLIEWHLGEDQQINALFRERRRGWYFDFSLSQDRKGTWSKVRKVCPIFLPLLEPDEHLWHELTCSALPEDWYALDEIIRLGIKFQGSQLRWAGQYAIGENVADDAMEKFGVYVPDKKLLPVFLFINKRLGLLLVSYFKHPDGFAKENLLRDGNINECCVTKSLIQAQHDLEEKLQSYPEREIN